MARELTLEDVQSLRWLADAPLFVDADQVAALYDAVISPEAEEMSITRSIKDSKKSAGDLGLQVGGEVSIAHFLTQLFPFLDAKVSATAKGGVRLERGREEQTSIEMRRIHTPQRQLVQLALHYIIDLPYRTKFVRPQGDFVWATPEYIDTPPRVLLFFELPPGTTLIPTAAEVSTGEVVPLYNQLVRRSGERPLDYPERGPGKPAGDLLEARKRYWNWFSEQYSSKQAMEVIEAVGKAGGSVRWIDYRLPIGTEGTTVHLHVQGHEKYHTGVFAYNMVKRADEHGIRIVGTLKSGPDINVLAMFER